MDTRLDAAAQSLGHVSAQLRELAQLLGSDAMRVEAMGVDAAGVLASQLTELAAKTEEAARKLHA